MISLARCLIVLGCVGLSSCDSRSAREAEQLGRFPSGVIFTDLESPPPAMGRGIADCLRAAQAVIGRGVCVPDKSAPVPGGGFAAPKFGVWTYEYVTTTQGTSAKGEPLTVYGDIEDMSIGLESQGEYVDNEPTGPWTFWHPNGEIRATGSFVAGTMSGPWLFRMPDGSVDTVHSGVYANDVLTSPLPK